MKHYVMEIDGMACSMCEAHVCGTIHKAFDVKKVKADHRKGTCEADAEELNFEEVKKALDPTGYILLSLREEEKKRSFFG